MKKELIYQVILVISGLIFAGTAYTGNMNHSADEMSGSSNQDKVFHDSVIDGYKLKYKLIDMREKLKKLKNIQGMDHVTATHHLMVLIKKDRNGDEKSVTKAKVGFLLTGPDGKKQKAMTMAMKGGFGADINLTKKGTYNIKTKVIDAGKKLMDQFSYHVK